MKRILLLLLILVIITSCSYSALPGSEGFTDSGGWWFYQLVIGFFEGFCIWGPIVLIPMTPFIALYLAMEKKRYGKPKNPEEKLKAYCLKENSAGGAPISGLVLLAVGLFVTFLIQPDRSPAKGQLIPFFAEVIPKWFLIFITFKYPLMNIGALGGILLLNRIAINPYQSRDRIKAVENNVFPDEELVDLIGNSKDHDFRHAAYLKIQSNEIRIQLQESYPGIEEVKESTDVKFAPSSSNEEFDESEDFLDQLEKEYEIERAESDNPYESSVDFSSMGEENSFFDSENHKVPVPLNKPKGKLKYFEVPPFFSDRAFCAAPGCSCDTSELMPSNSYAYISSEVVQYRQDCLKLDEARKKEEQMKDSMGLGNFTFMGGGMTPKPIIMCEEAAKKYQLDLNTANKDGKMWWSQKKLPLRETPRRS